MKKYYSLVKEGDEADIIVFGDITSWPWLESDVSSYNLQREIAGLEVNRINVHINSYGGECAEALAIYNTLKRHPAEVVTYVDGFACSAATVIFMAGSRRIMAQASNFLVHPAWSQISGNAEALRKEAESLDAITEQSIKAYMTGLKKSREELLELMAEEKFLTPEQALEWGFATEIEEAEDEKKPSQSAKHILSAAIQRGQEQDAVPAGGKPQHEEGTTNLKTCLNRFLDKF